MRKTTITHKVETRTKYEKGIIVGRKVVAKIEFEFDEDLVNEGLDTRMTDEELVDHAIDNFVDDAYTMMKYNELHEAVRVEIKG